MFLEEAGPSWGLFLSGAQVLNREGGTVPGWSAEGQRFPAGVTVPPEDVCQRLETFSFVGLGGWWVCSWHRVGRALGCC